MRKMFFLLPLAAHAALAANVPAPKPCSAPEYHQFDFWIGDWNVQENGAPAGTNNVESILDGCIVRENWVGTDGSKGTSLNRWDPAAKKWHQTWVDNRGGKLELSGGFQNGTMTLAGERASSRDPKGKILDRITWQKLPDGRVHQVWTASRDGGKTWQGQFDGFYTLKKPR